MVDIITCLQKERSKRMLWCLKVCDGLILWLCPESVFTLQTNKIECVSLLFEKGDWGKKVWVCLFECSDQRMAVRGTGFPRQEGETKTPAVGVAKTAGAKGRASSDLPS